MNATVIPTLPALDALLPSRAAQAARHHENGAGSFAASLREANRDSPVSITSSSAPQISRAQANPPPRNEAARTPDSPREERRVPGDNHRATDTTNHAADASDRADGHGASEPKDRSDGIRDRAARSRSDRGRTEHRRDEHGSADKPEAGVEGETPVSEGRAGARKKLSHKPGKAADSADLPDPTQPSLQAQTPKPTDAPALLQVQPTPSETQAAEAKAALLASQVALRTEVPGGTAIGTDVRAATPSLLSGSATTAADNATARAARQGSKLPAEAGAPGRGNTMPAMQDDVEGAAQGDSAQVPPTGREARETRPARVALEERSAPLAPDNKPLLIDTAPLREALATPLAKLADQAASISSIQGALASSGLSGASALAIGTQSLSTQGGAAAAEHTLAAQPGSPDFTRALGAQVAMWASEGTREARLQLNPAELGPVLVHITLDGAQARVDFHAHAAATRDAIEASLPALAGALSEQGLTLSGGGVFDRGGSQRERDAEQARPAANHAAQASEDPNAAHAATSLTPTRVTVRQGLVDLMA